VIYLETVILDSNIFLGYANKLEHDHFDCRDIFKRSFKLITCKRVVVEIRKVLKRRNHLYRELARLIERGIDLKEIFRGKKLNDNDKRDLARTITWVNKFQGDKLHAIRRFNNSIKTGIRDALRKIKHPLIDYAWDHMFFASVSSCVTNNHDAWIIVDCFLWCESNDHSILCSKDETDIIKNRNDIERIYLNYRPLISTSPLRIMRISELLALDSI